MEVFMLDNIMDLKKDNFTEEVLNSKIPVLVDFWAIWCNPCKMLSPIIDQIAEEMSGEIKIGKVNVDEEGMLSVEYGVMNIPTLLMVKDGKVVSKLVGLHSKEDILDFIESSL
jgi:thioredoxin 1